MNESLELRGMGLLDVGGDQGPSELEGYLGERDGPSVEPPAGQPNDDRKSPSYGIIAQGEEEVAKERRRQELEPWQTAATVAIVGLLVWQFGGMGVQAISRRVFDAEINITPLGLLRNGLEMWAAHRAGVISQREAREAIQQNAQRDAAAFLVTQPEELLNKIEPGLEPEATDTQKELAQGFLYALKQELSTQEGDLNLTRLNYFLILEEARSRYPGIDYTYSEENTIEDIIHTLQEAGVFEELVSKIDEEDQRIRQWIIENWDDKIRDSRPISSLDIMSNSGMVWNPEALDSDRQQLSQVPVPRSQKEERSAKRTDPWQQRGRGFGRNSFGERI